jgi:hypothetical protein
MKSPKLRPTLRSLLKPIRPSLPGAPTTPGKDDKFYWRDASQTSLLELRTDLNKAHGPFPSEDDAVDDAIKNLEEQYADKLNRALGDIKI